MNDSQRELLTLLADGEFHSGETLSQHLQVSRAAVWKNIRQLEHLGLEIESRHGTGYRLLQPLQLLERDAIGQHLEPAGREFFQEMEILAQVDSTNTYISRLLEQNSCHGKVVLAEYQSQGKGRRGNEWISPVGSGVYLSMAWHTDKPVAATGLISLFVGVAVARSLKQLGIDNVSLKWPNDILINDEKLAGVLVEMRGEANGPVDMICGIGINYALPEMASQIIAQPVTDLSKHLPEPVSRNELAATLINSLFAVLTETDKQDIDGLLDEWRQFDRFRDRRARLILPREEIQGILQGIDDDGSLLMLVDGHIQRYAFGEISLRMQA